jgi:hypothetical protein
MKVRAEMSVNYTWYIYNVEPKSIPKTT